MAEERPIRPSELKAGQSIPVGSITIEIVEVIPTSDIMGRKIYMIGYRIRDGNYVSPVGHWFVMEGDDVRKWIKETAKFYLDVRDKILKR